MSQTTIQASGQTIGVPGMIADSADVIDIVSGFNPSGGVQLPFGYGLRDNGTNRDQYVLATGFSGVYPVAGINVFDLSHMRQGAADGAGNFAGDLGGSGIAGPAGIQVGRKGRFLVPVEVAPTIGDGAWCRGVATGNLGAGIWRSAARGAAGPLSASYHVDCSKQAVFRSTSFTAADGTTLVAVLEVDFLNSVY